MSQENTDDGLLNTILDEFQTSMGSSSLVMRASQCQCQVWESGQAQTRRKAAFISVVSEQHLSTTFML